MRKLLSVLCLLSLLFQVFFVTGLSLDYKLDLKSYAEKCINKSKPELACEGKCILMQKINQAEEKEKGGGPFMAENQTVNYILLTELHPSSSPTFFEIKRMPFTPSIPINTFQRNIFHPPRA